MATSPNFNWPEPDNTDLVKNGALAIRTAVDAIDTSMTDLLGGTTGQVLTKASGTDMDFTWATASGGSNLFYAGKNKLINGDFYINQRSFTSNTTTLSYNFDRWLQFNGGTTGTLTVTPQTFTLGTAPVSGYEGKNFLQGITASGASTNTFAGIAQKIESVRTFAGQTVTISFWAKASSGTPKIATEFTQNFGSGGSPSSEVYTSGSAVTISTSWARYSTTVAVPSISGKTLGTAGDYLQANLWLSAGSALDARASSIGLQNNTFQIWGIQLEAGSTATDFQTATGTIQGELSACQRYYYRSIAGALYQVLGSGYGGSSTNTYIGTPLPVQMRVAPTSVEFANLAINFGGSYYAISAGALSTDTSTVNLGWVNWTNASGTTGGSPYVLRSNASASGYVGFSAEF
jgi:hypothetical protein